KTAGGQEIPAALQAIIEQSPNADRAVATYNELQKLQAADTKHKRPDDQTIQLLTEAVARPRSESVHGMAGVMSQDTALRTARVLAGMSDDDYKRSMELVNGAATGAKDAHLEQGLLLKTLGANPVAGLPPARKDAFFKQVEQFAKDTHGKERQELIANT